MKQSGQDKGTLLLALIAGLSINGTFAALFSAIVPFSVFPVISLPASALPKSYYAGRFAGVGRRLFHSWRFTV